MASIAETDRALPGGWTLAWRYGALGMLLIAPTILIMDDSTSAVDMETEFRLQEALDELMGVGHEGHEMMPGTHPAGHTHRPGN